MHIIINIFNKYMILCIKCIYIYILNIKYQTQNVIYHKKHIIYIYIYYIKHIIYNLIYYPLYTQ